MAPYIMQKTILTGISFIAFTMYPSQSYASDRAKEKTTVVTRQQMTDQNPQTEKPCTESNAYEEIIGLERAKQKIELENALNKARLEKELAALQEDISRLMVKRELMVLKWQIEQEEKEKAHQTTMIALSKEQEKLEVEVTIAQHKLDKKEQQMRAATMKLKHELTLLQAQIDQLHVKRAKYVALRQSANYIDTHLTYLKNPLQNGSLIISDRYIELNGIITPWKANYVTDRIQYFNNKDISYPIFIVIESSPGGSVSAGARILKAMENSQAPVYVVVKSFAASMAALITSLADQSYAYPDAVILHHQPWTSTGGNVRDLKEQQAHLQEWWRRLGGRLAKKMGISLVKLDKLLYEKSARGDWLEFADCAKKLKWVDYTIQGIKHIDVRELPHAKNYNEENYLEKYFGSTFQPISSTGNRAIYLPFLTEKDFYYLYNPDNLYQRRPISTCN